jgi:undecaprenyl-diphosphatase
MGPLRGVLRWIGKHELGVIMAVAVLALGALVFVKLAAEVSDGEPQNIDRALLLTLRDPADPSDPIGSEWVEELGRDATALGGFVVLTMLTVGVVGHLLLSRKPHAAGFVTGAVLGATALTGALKSMFGRPRPELVPHLAYVESSSFPSAHSMLSAAVYLTLGALLARLQPNLLLKAYVLLWALLLTVLVGVSRVYIGVHWPTDVLAGWAAGAAWAALCWVVARALQRRRLVESSSGGPPGPTA